MTQSYADFASQMTIMKRKKVLESPDYETAKATIVQLVLGGLGLSDKAAPQSPAPRPVKRK
jgi:TetR/AcrR family transcriptional regulator